MIRPTAAFIAALLALTLSACGGGEDESAPEPEPQSVIPSPSEQEGDQLVAELEALVPGLGAQREDTIDSARNLCSSIIGGGQNLERNAAVRFSTGDLEVTEDQGAQIVELVRSQPWCE